MSEEDILYPNIDDTGFNVKLFSKREFKDIAYKKSKEDFNSLVESACSGFELSPHQLFVKQLISNQTPYNSLLLYHGLGSGKTCSAIGISEEMRDYMRYMGIKKKIYVLATTNVQDNFKRQLFDENKLEFKDGIYNLKSCVGNKLIDEINVANIRTIKQEQLKTYIKQLIRKYYDIMGYLEFANEVERQLNIVVGTETDNEKIKRKEQNWIKNTFSNTMIIIDEVHNIREMKESGDENVKKIQMILKKVAKYSHNMKLIILSATPMYNDVREIIWILNILRLNDGRERIKVSDIFDKEGGLVKDVVGQDVGKKRLENLARGYVSFVRGEDPYSFPYRIFPSLFNDKMSVFKLEEYPSIQADGTSIEQGIRFIDIYLNSLGKYQQQVYLSVLWVLKMREGQKMNYQQMGSLIQALNIVYPSKKKKLTTTRLKTVLDEERPMLEIEPEVSGELIFDKVVQKGGNNEETEIDILPENMRNVVGSKGLRECMSYNQKTYSGFKYKSGYPKVFSSGEIAKYSAKIGRIMECIKNSVGIVLVYSEYIEGGCIPIALALEEAGISRYQLRKEQNLFEKNKLEIKMKYGEKSFRPKYVMITGNKELSPDNAKAVMEATTNNEYGQKIKVIIISRSGAEGIDFNSIRQVHILDPWYNMSRIEQIIGRGVRFCSHKTMPFVDRNVEIYLHGTKPFDDIEPADLYMYRQAEHKAVRIGEVSRILKETAVDCLLNMEHNIKTVENIGKKVMIRLASKKEIEYEVGDKPFTSLCDYMDSCSYQCKPELPTKFTAIMNDSGNMDTYSAKHMNIHLDKIILRIKYLFRQRFVYGTKELIVEIQRGRDYTIKHMMSAIDYLLDGNEYLIDMTGRGGKLVLHGNYYYFKPNEYIQNEMPMYERRLPYRYMPRSIMLRQREKQVRINVASLLDTIHKTYERFMKSYELFKDIVEIDNIDAIIGDAVVDGIDTEKKLEIFNYGWKNREKVIYDYIQRRLINGKYLLIGGIGNIRVHTALFVLEDNFVISKPTEHMSIKSELIERYDKREKTFNRNVGMIYHQKGRKTLLFKIRDIKEQTSTGASVQQMMFGNSKKGILMYYYELLGEDIYRQIKEKNIAKQHYVDLLELLYRHYQDIEKDRKQWFLRYEEALYTDIEHRKAKATEIE
jgi:superfamily II DNA or RNA helicase